MGRRGVGGGGRGMGGSWEGMSRGCWKAPAGEEWKCHFCPRGSMAGEDCPSALQCPCHRSAPPPQRPSSLRGWGVGCAGL